MSHALPGPSSLLPSFVRSRKTCTNLGRIQLSLLILIVLALMMATGSELGAQSKQWVWMGGSTTADQPGVNGTLGSPAAANVPGGRAYPTSWTDGGGNLWLFGGSGVEGVGSYGFYNDLWKFTPSTLEWTWMGGSSSPACADCGERGVYGTLGIASAGNTPGGRLGAAGWVDRSGQFWLFGGAGIDSNGVLGELNDLWKWDPNSREWAWMGGSTSVIRANDGQAGVYGTLGVASASNIPGGRQFASSWGDNKGNFWLFGGAGIDSTGTHTSLNDLWMYSPSTGQWTWMGGSNKGALPGVPGTKGVPSAANIPSARNAAASWTDKNGNFWLFGGYGTLSSKSYGYLNDLWEFNPSSGQWTWVTGSTTDNGAGGWPGIYGTRGVAASSNTPGGRETAGGWVDAAGDLWLLGGYGIDKAGGQGNLNDLWRFDAATSQWTWIGGVSGIEGIGSQPGVYGNEGIAASGNAPGARGSAAYWTDNIGRLWLFGGFGLGSTAASEGDLNDLWVYGVPAPTPIFSLPGGSYNGDQSLTLSSSVPGSTIYYTTDGSTPTVSSHVYASPIQLTEASQTVRMFAASPGYVDSALASATYTLNLPPPTSPIFTPTPGTYSSPQTLTISDTTPGATIYYALNGAVPNANSTRYVSPLTVSSTETVKAIAYAHGIPSAITSGLFTILPPPQTAAPQFSRASGSFGSGFFLTLSDASTGAVIYFTTDGSTPTANSEVYGAPILVASTETIKAIALAPGFQTSRMITGTYLIAGTPIAVILPASAITTPNATLNASVNPLGVTATYSFQYGTSSNALTSATPSAKLAATSSAVNVSAGLTALTPKTTYYFRAVVTTIGGSATSAIQSFTTN